MEGLACWEGLAGVYSGRFAWFLDVFPILSTALGLEPKSNVCVATVAASGPSGPVPFAALTHVTSGAVDLANDNVLLVQVGAWFNAVIDAVTGSVVSTMAISSSGHGTDAARNRACAPVGPCAVVVAWRVVALDGLDLILNAGVLAAP